MAFNPITQTYDIIADIKDSKGSPNAFVRVLGYYTPGDGGGGEFYWDNLSTDAEDDGTVFEVPGVATGRWKRIITDNRMNVLWFGAVGDNNLSSASVNSAAFDACKNALPRIVQGLPEAQTAGRIYIPRGRYFLADTFLLDAGFHIEGDAANGGGYVESTLIFPNQNSGIEVQTIDPSNSRSGGGAVIDRIRVSAYFLNINDPTVHGFKIKGQTTLRNCYAENWPGDGYNLDTDAGSPGTDQFGNAAFTILEGCRAYNNRHGFYTHGGDSSVILFNTCDATGNRQWGFREDGFLGNTYLNCHAADNTYTAGTMAQVTHNGGYYIAVQDNTNIEPGVHANWNQYWVDMGTPGFTTYYQPWNNATTFLAGGAYSSWPGLNSNNLYINCYAEGGQPGLFGPRSMVLNGNLAALVFPEGLPSADMRLTVVGGKYNTQAPFQHARSDRDYIFEFGGEGAYSIGPAEALVETIPALKYIWDYHEPSRKFRNYYNNFGNTGMAMTTSTTNAADYGLSSILMGMLEFTRGIFLGRQVGGGFRRFTMGTAVPNTGEWAVGDIVLKSISAPGDTVLGWRCTVAGTPGTWETMNITIS